MPPIDEPFPKCQRGGIVQLRRPRDALMTKPIVREPIYRRRRFDAEFIELCVRCYITHRFSYRDLVAMMTERGIVVSHTTMHWVIRYVPEFEKRWNRFAVVAAQDHARWPLAEPHGPSTSAAGGFEVVAC
jgi:hypothetical protein